MPLELKEPIVTEALKCFHLYGFRRTSVDEIATNMGISKKTIYKHFSSKDELIHTVITQVMEPFLIEVNSIIDQDISVPDAFQQLLKAIQKLSSSVSRPMMDDIRMLPGAWEFIKDEREKILRNFSIILVRGKEKGAIKEDLNIDLFIKILINTFDTLANPSTFTTMGLNSEDVADQLFSIFMEGILLNGRGL
jgi:AcrR family transcriptional regulator